MVLEAENLRTNELQNREKSKAGYRLLGSEFEFSVNLRAVSFSVRQKRSWVTNSQLDQT